VLFLPGIGLLAMRNGVELRVTTRLAKSHLLSWTFCNSLNKEKDAGPAELDRVAAKILKKWKRLTALPAKAGPLRRR
jgi:hypothetical protein